MEYKLPKLKDLRVDKLQYFEMLNELKDTEHIPVKDIVKLNAIFTGLDESYLLTVTKKSNYELSNSIMALLNSYKPKEISTTIKLNGQEYVLQEDLGKMPTAFWVDLSNQDMAKNPIRMASSIYIEKGMKYSQLDSNKNIINPVSKRDEIFKEHLPLTDFLDIQGFFLHRYNELTPLYMEAKVILAKKLQADINGMM